MNNISDDISLFLKVKANDKGSFDLLFKKYYTPLCRYTIQFIKDNTIAEELVQDVFVNLWIQRAEIKIGKSLASYLFTSARYRAYTYFRKEFSRKENEKLFSDGQDYEETYNEEESFEMAVSINKAIDELPDKCREIFILSREKNLTYKQIAEQLNISVKTVENQMGIAFKKLRHSLGKSLNANNLKLAILLMYC